MIPQELTLPSGVTESRFFMMEQPGLDIWEYHILVLMLEVVTRQRTMTMMALN
jgi:hypothetical protein